MNSFYGGKQGFSFILRPNTASSDRYWHSLAEIQALGINRGALKYGDYAVITESGPSYSDEHGKVYRIDNANVPVLVGKIGNPAPLYNIELTDDRKDAQSIVFNFMDETSSRFQTGVTGYWKMIKNENDEDVIGISFDFPVPAISFTNVPFNNFESNRKAGITRTVNTLENRPMEYFFENVIPPATYIGDIQERYNISNLDPFNEGDLWFQVFNAEEDKITTEQKTILFSSELSQLTNQPNYEECLKINFSTYAPHGSGPIMVDTTELDILGDAVQDALVCDFSFFSGEAIDSVLNSLKISNISNFSKISANLSLKDSPYVEDIYQDYVLTFIGYSQTEDTDVNADEDHMFIVYGKAGEKKALIIYGKDMEEVNLSDLIERYDILIPYRIVFYNKNNTYADHMTITRQGFPAIYSGNEDNNTTTLLNNYIKSLGVTFYPF